MIISVLMPVFKSNREWLEIAINSILAQTLEDFELLILYEPFDHDGLESFFSELDDKRIKIIKLPVKYGLPRSLNEGIKIAKGEYLARMDADDESMPDRFEKQVRYMEEHPEVDILGGVIKIMEQDEYMFNRIPTPEARKIMELFGNSGGIGHPTAMYRKASFDKTGLIYDENLKGSEDYDLWTRALAQNMVIDSISDVVLNYRVHNSQASVVMNYEMKEWDINIGIRYADRFCELTQEDMEVMKSFFMVEKPHYPISAYDRLFRKLEKGNEERRVCEKDAFDRELAWQWVRRAVYLMRRCNCYKMMFSKRTIKNLISKHGKYIIKQYRDIRNGTFMSKIECLES